MKINMFPKTVDDNTKKGGVSKYSIMRPKTKIRRIYILIVALCIIAFISWFFSQLSIIGKETMKNFMIDSISYSNIPFSEYQKDFNFRKGLHLKVATFSKTRRPIEEFIYQNSYVFLYRLPVKSNKSLPEVLKLKHTELSMPLGVDYYELGNLPTNSYEILYRPGRPDSGTEINFNFFGKYIQVFKNNDTTYQCYFQLGSFSINYNNSELPDFYGDKQSDAKMALLPMEIFFEKKKQNYYLLLVIPKDK